MVRWMKRLVDWLNYKEEVYSVLGWIVAVLVFVCWTLSSYKIGKVIIELKKQIISLSYYAGVPHDQMQKLKEKYGIK